MWGGSESNHCFYQEYEIWMVCSHELQYCLVSSEMGGSTVSCWWDSVSQATTASLLGVVVLSWVVGVVSRRGNPDKTMLVESVFLGCVFSDKYSRGHGGFKLIIHGVCGVFIIEN